MAFMDNKQYDDSNLKNSASITIDSSMSGQNQTKILAVVVIYE